MIFLKWLPTNVKSIENTQPSQKQLKSKIHASRKMFCFKSKYSIATKDITFTQCLCLMLKVISNSQGIMFVLQICSNRIYTKNKLKQLTCLQGKINYLCDKS